MSHILTLDTYDLAALIRSIETAAWVSIDIMSDGNDWFLARAMVDGEETSSGYRSRTIENASGDSKLAAVTSLAAKLNSNPYTYRRLDAFLDGLRAPVVPHVGMTAAEGVGAVSLDEVA